MTSDKHINNIEISGIGQIAVAVTDIARARHFYQKTLGLTLLFDAGENLSFYQCAGIRLMLTTLQGKEQDHHTSVIYYRVTDIGSIFDYFSQQTVTIERYPEHVAKMEEHDLWMGFIRDPDNNLIGIMEELPLTT